MILSEEKGASQRVLLLVLLLVVVLFGYLYFFTGLIKPHEEETKPPAPAAPAPMAKQPIPPRPGAEEAGKAVSPSTLASKSPAATVAPVKKNTVVLPTSAPKGKSEEPKAPVTPQSTRDAVKPASNPAAPVKKPLPASVAATKEKAVPSPQKAQKKATSTTAKASPPQKTVPARFTLLVGDFILDSDLKKAERQLRKAGNTFTVISRRKTEPMHRVHLADFVKRADADAELKKVQKLAGSSFVLPVKDRYSLFAGSYFSEQQATKEKVRLSGKGLAATLEKADVAVPVKRVSTGAFGTKEQAEREATRLRKAGIKASVVPVGK